MKLRLEIEIEYEDIEHIPVGQLKANLDYLAALAAGEGLFTGDLDIETSSWCHRILEIP